MAEQPQSKSLRDYASFELERRGYNRAQVDAFIAELDQAFIDMEASVKERGEELAELQQEVERLKRESPVGRSEELLRRAELNAEQMLASSLAESQEIIGHAEALSMRIIANARAQSQEIAAQPAGFGMLARVRTIAADIDRMKAEHAALMDDSPEQLMMPTEVAYSSQSADRRKSDVPAASAEQPEITDTPTEKVPVAKKEPAEEKQRAATPPAMPKAAKLRPATTPAYKAAASKAAPQELDKAADADGTDAEAEIVVAPRIQLIEPPPLPKIVVAAAYDDDFDDESSDDDEEAAVDTKNFDWSVARARVQEQSHDLGEAAYSNPLAVVDDGDADTSAGYPRDSDGTRVPTIMRRQGSRYERHSASLPKIGNEGESTLSDVAKVSRRRRRHVVAHDDDPS